MTMRKHRVRPGEQLVDLSKQYYGTTRYANVIWQHNRAIISNPNQIYAGQVVTIPHIKIRHGW